MRGVYFYCHAAGDARRKCAIAAGRIEAQNLALGDVDVIKALLGNAPQRRFAKGGGDGSRTFNNSHVRGRP